jgi:uncharacterized delta-60 repeat protein
MRSTLIHLLLLASLPAGPLLGSPAGELDPAFGDHGRVLLRDPPFEELAGVDVIVDPGSGKFLVVGDGYHDDKLLRFNSDGSLDPGFGVQGTAPLDFGDDDLNIYDVERLANGKLLVAGALNVYGTPDNVIHGSALLARMHADGTPDASFGSGGRAVLQLGGVFESISEILLQPDGRIVVFGSTNRTGGDERILARFTQDGALDSSFGNGATPGISVIDVLGVEAQLATIVQQNDGKFLVCGNASLSLAVPDAINIVAIRIQPGGAPDSTFGSNGLLLIGGWQERVAISDCLELADGHVIFLGASGSGERQRAAAWRMAPDGRLDTSFGIGGMRVLDTDTPSAATAMLIMADGSLAIAGSQWKPSDKWQGDNNAWLWWSDMLVARIDATSGAVDRAFGNRGMTVVDFGAHGFASNAMSAGIRQQADGKLLIVGSQVDLYDWYPWYSIAIARVDPYGAGSNGWAGLVDTYAYASPTDNEVQIHLRRTGGSSGQLTVDYRTVDDTATAGKEYVATSGTVSWDNGDLSDKAVSIRVHGANLVTNYAFFKLELFNSSGGLAQDQATVSINRHVPPTSSQPAAGGGGAGNGGGAIGIELWFLLLLALRHKKGAG